MDIDRKLHRLNTATEIAKLAFVLLQFISLLGITYGLLALISDGEGIILSISASVMIAVYPVAFLMGRWLDKKDYELTKCWLDTYGPYYEALSDEEKKAAWEKEWQMLEEDENDK